MKKIFAYLLSLIIAYTPALLFASDIDFNKRYQKGNWKVENKGINPYNSGGSTQDDYLNTTRWNVQGERRDVSNGSVITKKATASVTTSHNEIKETIKNRLKNLGKHSKDIGKMTAGGFLGSAALTALIEGIGWVMDEGGKVTMLPDPSVIIPQHERYRWSYTDHSTTPISTKYAYTPQDACTLQIKSYGRSAWFLQSWSLDSTKIAACKFQNGTDRVNRVSNPIYDPSYVADRPEVSDSEFETAFEKALQKNNPALAGAIATAIKDSFIESPLDTDPQTGQKKAPIPAKVSDALDDAVIEADDPEVCVPTVGDLQGTCTPMSESEAQKVPDLICVQNQTVSFNSCVYVVDPDAPPKSAVSEKPKVNPETGELPEVCDWFEIHCKWIEWTQKEADKDTDTEVQFQEKDDTFDFNIFNKNRFSVSNQCPVYDETTLEIGGISTSFSFNLTPLCDVLTLAKPALIACSYLYAAYIIIGASRNG